jgi:hypothetical protein
LTLFNEGIPVVIIELIALIKLFSFKDVDDISEFIDSRADGFHFNSGTSEVIFVFF